MRCFTERGAHEIFFVGWIEEKRGEGFFYIEKKIGITILIKDTSCIISGKIWKVTLKIFPLPLSFHDYSV